MPRDATSSPPDGRGYVPLRSGSRFAELYRNGRRRRRAGIVAITGPGHDVNPEVGVVAGKKVGNAVQRNRAKRRMREAAGGLALEAGTAYVFIASPSVVDVAFRELVEWMADAADVEVAP